MRRRRSHQREKRWYTDKQNLALVLGFISTLLTIINTFLGKG